MDKLTEKEFSTSAVKQMDDKGLQQSQIYINGEATGAFVVGAILEACIKVNTFYLLFMTDDIPNEDMLHIYLFNEKMDLLDSMTLGSPYATGSFRNMVIREPDIVHFNFIGSTQWEVKIFQEKQLYFPFISDPKGVSRKSGLSCYLKIRGRPIPEKR